MSNRRAFRLSLFCLLLFGSYVIRTCAASPAPGEIALTGRIFSLDPTAHTLTLQVTSCQSDGRPVFIWAKPRKRLLLRFVGLDRGVGMRMTVRDATPTGTDAPSGELREALEHARAEVASSAPLLMAVATLNTARRQAGLSPLALDPAMQCIAEVVSADTNARFRTQQKSANDPSLPMNLSQQLCGRSDCQMGGFSSGKLTLGEAANQLLVQTTYYRNQEFGDRRFVLDPDFQTIGLTINSMADQHSHNFPEGWYDYVTAYGRGTPSPNSVIPLTLEQPEAWPHLTFPVLGGAHWSDTFGQPRPGHIHIGEDLMAPKMRPLVACLSGIVDFGLRGAAGNTITVSGDDGWSGVYLHVNCDTPGTHDGQGGIRYAVAPGLKSGDRVRAGQWIGYVGDSGDARGGPPHCHFELHTPSGTPVNPARALRAAPILRRALPALSAEQQAAADRCLVQAGEIQLDGTVVRFTPGTLLMQARRVIEPAGSMTQFLIPREKRVLVPKAWSLPPAVSPGGHITVVGRNAGHTLVPRLIVFGL